MFFDGSMANRLLAARELDTIRRVLEREFRSSHDYVAFLDVVEHYSPSHS
jgi:hypothetical protein